MPWRAFGCFHSGVPGRESRRALLRVLALAADPDAPPLLFHISTFREVGPVTKGMPHGGAPP